MSLMMIDHFRNGGNSKVEEKGTEGLGESMLAYIWGASGAAVVFVPRQGPECDPGLWSMDFHSLRWLVLNFFTGSVDRNQTKQL